MRHPSDGTPWDPRVLCVGMALCEALPVLPRHHRLTVAARTIVREAERYRPDVIELDLAWETALAILTKMSEECRVGALGLLLIEQLEIRPFGDGGR